MNTPRQLTAHQVTPNDTLEVAVLDLPGAGGAHHLYQISEGPLSLMNVQFQNGPISEAGVNGVTHEALLAIIADRLESFQAGPYNCQENANALHHVNEALHWLHRRTTARMLRGVEGTHQV